MSSTVHNFREDLEKSHAVADESFWGTVYKRAFPTMRQMLSVNDDGWAQRGGIDRVIILASGRVLNIEEKVRYQDHPDILLEVYSNYERKTPGWIAKDQATDFLAYAIPGKGKCYILPWHSLRLAYYRNKDRWWEECKHINAKNERYTTTSIAVGLDDLKEAMIESMVVCWPVGDVNVI